MPQPEPIDPGKYNFPTLMNDIENGRVRLPPFQRESSHLIPSSPDSPIWTNDFDAFLQQRTDLIWAEILKAVGKGDIYDAGAQVPRDQARLAVDEIELKLRRVLNGVLRSHLGDNYWKIAVPGDLQAKIKERINEQNKTRLVTRIEDPLIRLQYADIMDYHKIIDKNWKLFVDRFGSREEMKTHFLALKNYRNPLGHVRDMDPIDQKRGEAAILWFRKTLATPVCSAVTIGEGTEEIPQSVASTEE